MPHLSHQDRRLAYELTPCRSERPEPPAGLPVVLVMGMGLPGAAWGFQRQALAAERPVLTFDNRGVGGSDAPRGLYRMRDLAGDTLALMDHLGWERAHIAGISMGGCIALEVGLAAPERTASLALLATTAGGRLWWWPPSLRAARWTPEVLLARGERRLRALQHQLLSPSGLARADRESLTRRMAEHIPSRPPLRGSIGQLAGVLTYDARHRLPELAGLPTLVVQAGEDSLIPPRRSVELAAGIPGARLVVFPDSGHGLILQYPEPLSRLLAGHFRQAEGRAEAVSER